MKYFLVTMSVVSVLCAALFLFETIVDFLLNSFFNLSLIFGKLISMDNHFRGVI